MKKIAFAIAIIPLSLFCSAQDAEKSFTPQIGILTTTTPTLQVKGRDSSYSKALAVAPVIGLLHKSGLGI
jgi:hypothetical protein